MYPSSKERSENSSEISRFTKPVPIIVCSLNETKVHSIADLEEKITLWLRALDSCDILVVGIPSSERIIELIAILYALIERRIPFHFIPSTQDATTLPSHISHIVKFSSGQKEVQQIMETSPSVVAKLADTGVDRLGGLAYCIQTSGTTGSAKTVAVPWDCILTNVIDFLNVFGISEDDVILFSTSLLFDPSVIELFMSIFSGAKLVVVPDSFRSHPKLLIECMRNTRPTVIQLTPAILSLIDETTLRWLLGPDSPLRVLLIGGDKFPLDLIRRYRDPSNPTRIFDVYGITEVSCWATRFEVKHDCSAVFVGDAIDGTRLQLLEDGELLLGGSRQCSVDYQPIDVNQLRGTGDIVEECAGGRLLIIGRTDDQVKINGIRCNLSSMSAKLTAHIGYVRSARFVRFQKKFLVLFVVADTNLSTADLESSLHPMLKPSKIVYLDHLPVNNNGKVDVPALVMMLVDVDSSTEITSFLKQHHIDVTDAAVMEKSFVEFGFDSLLAAELSLLLGSAEAMADILSDQMSIEGTLNKYKKNKELKDTSSIEELSSSSSRTVAFVDHRMPDVAWAYDTHKCIDGNTVIFTGNDNCQYVFVASHSGRVAVIELRTGRVKIEASYPTRFEASPIFHNGSIVLGGYNGILYTWHQDDLQLLSKTDLGDQIKAAAVIEEYQEGMHTAIYAFVIAYNKSLYKVNVTDGSFRSTPVASGSPAEVLLHQGNVICSTIKGTVECFDKVSLAPIWMLDLRFPIFSSITVLPASSSSQIPPNGVVGDVHGNLCCIELTEGLKVASLSLNEPIFAKCQVVDDHLLVATQKGSLYIVNITSFLLMRKLLFPGCSFVRAPVVRPSDGMTYLMSTDGWLCLWRSRSQSPEVHRYRMCPAGNVFSMVQFVDASDGPGRSTDPSVPYPNSGASPSWSPCLVVGSRDNWLRCFYSFKDPVVLR